MFDKDIEGKKDEVERLLAKFKRGFNEFCDEEKGSVEAQVVAAAVAYFIAEVACHTGQPSSFMMALDVGVRSAFRGFEQMKKDETNVG